MYRGTVSGGTKYRTHTNKVVNVCCNYAFVTGKTCLRYNGADDPRDIRGCDSSNCNLYQKGPELSHRVDTVVPKRGHIYVN